MLANVLAIFLSVVGLAFCLTVASPALWLLVRGLCPNLTRLASRDCEKALWKPFLTGIPFTIFIFFEFAILWNANDIGRLIALSTAGLWLLYSSIGVSGLADKIGRQLFGNDLNQHDAMLALKGGMILAFACLLPIPGLILLIPAVVTIGAGATTRAILTKVIHVKRAGSNFAPSGVSSSSEGSLKPLDSVSTGGDTETYFQSVE